MKYDLMKIDDYLFIIGDLYKSDKFPYLVVEKFGTDNNFSIWQVDNPNDLDDKNQYRILAHRPLNGARYLGGVDVLPSLPQEDDVDSICMKDLQDFFGTDIHLTPKGEEYISIFKTVYNKCREKYKFTEEDMLQAAKYGYEFRDTTSFPEHNFEDSCINNTKQWLKSRQQPKYPIAFECEVEPKFKHIGSTKEVKGSGSKIKNKYAGNPKTFINFDGRSEWVGKYIYE
jgi:hypothetical protein